MVSICLIKIIWIILSFFLDFLVCNSFQFLNSFLDTLAIHSSSSFLFVRRLHKYLFSHLSSCLLYILLSPSEACNANVENDKFSHFFLSLFHMKRKPNDKWNSTHSNTFFFSFVSSIFARLVSHFHSINFSFFIFFFCSNAEHGEKKFSTNKLRIIFYFIFLFFKYSKNETRRGNKTVA